MHHRSSSTDSRLSMTPLDMGLYKSFSYYGPPGFSRARATPAVSVSVSRHVSSSIWQPPELSSPPAKVTINAEQSTEIFNLVAECQALSTELAERFQTLSRLVAMHHVAAQATAHETIDARQMVPNMAYSILLDDQTQDKKHEETLQQLCAKADKAWKDTNNLVFNHQLCYDGQLAAFISNAERSPRRSRMRSGNASRVWQM